MSGIYIPGMEMPTSCCACPCSYDNQCAITNQYPTFEEWYEDKPKWCPLVPVPDHGRLVDADAPIPLREYQDEWKCGVSFYALVPDIRMMPTIIPADPADKEGE